MFCEKVALFRHLLMNMDMFMSYMNILNAIKKFISKMNFLKQIIWTLFFIWTLIIRVNIGDVQEFYLENECRLGRWAVWFATFRRILEWYPGFKAKRYWKGKLNKSIILIILMLIDYRRKSSLMKWIQIGNMTTRRNAEHFYENF